MLRDLSERFEIYEVIDTEGRTEDSIEFLILTREFSVLFIYLGLHCLFVRQPGDSFKLFPFGRSSFRYLRLCTFSVPLELFRLTSGCHMRPMTLILFSGFPPIGLPVLML